MLERAVAFVTCGTLPGVLVAKISRMLENSVGRLEHASAERLLQRCVTDRAVVSNYASVTARVLAVVTSETSLSVQVPEIIYVGLPIGLHLREEVCLIDLFHFGNGRGNGFIPV